MSQLLERPRTQPHGTGRITHVTREPMTGYLLLALGAIAALFGLYTFVAPTDWIWAGLEEAWYLGAYIVGGGLLTAGFGIEADRMHSLDGTWTRRALAGIVLAIVALAGAATAAVVLLV